MERFLIRTLMGTLILGGPIGCIYKAIKGIPQRRFLPKQYFNALEEGLI